MILNFLPTDTLSLRILKSDDSIVADLFSDQNISFTRYHTKYEADDGDTSLEYVRRRRAGGEPLTRRLREIMHDTLARELPELAVPTPGADLVAVVLHHRKHGLTHRSLVVDIIVNSGVVSLLECVLLAVFDHWTR